MTGTAFLFAFSTLVVSGSLAAQVLNGRGPGSAATSGPEAWGDAVGYSTISGLELKAEYSGDSTAGQYGTAVRRNSQSGIYCLSSSVSQQGGVPTYLFATLEVPEGARLDQFKYWAFDSASDRDLQFAVFETCQADGVNPPAVTLLGAGFTILAIGEYFGFTSLNDHPVNNRQCTYTVRVQFASSGEGCLGAALTVHKLQFSWYRHVSPPPATATFNDVPTDHLFFQFVEALAKSGITGGCSASPPLFCPDQALTRGQMAAFLAKGLGLQWP